jgi:hypothetical protein
MARLAPIQAAGHADALPEVVRTCAASDRILAVGRTAHPCVRTKIWRE